MEFNAVAIDATEFDGNASISGSSEGHGKLDPVQSIAIDAILMEIAMTRCLLKSF